MKSFVWKERANKIHRERRWFELWIKEAYSIRQLSEISGHSLFKLKQIKNYWLKQTPPEITDLSHYQYLIYDGTYFHKDGCFICLMCAVSQKIIAYVDADKEGYQSVIGWFQYLKSNGLSPRFITMDGALSVIQAVQEVWPQARIQRCLYHIQREGMRWLRTYPKTEAGQKLRILLKSLCRINTFKERDEFINSYHTWLRRYRKFVRSLPRTQVAFKDLKRTMSLIRRALPNMFHYLNEAEVHKTTNGMEGFHSRLKADYRRHRGLTTKHRISYLRWYCYFKNQPK